MTCVRTTQALNTVMILKTQWETSYLFIPRKDYVVKEKIMNDLNRQCMQRELIIIDRKTTKVREYNINSKPNLNYAEKTTTQNQV